MRLGAGRGRRAAAGAVAFGLATPSASLRGAPVSTNGAASWDGGYHPPSPGDGERTGENMKAMGWPNRMQVGLLLSALAWACSSAPPEQLGVVRGLAVDSNGNALPGITVTLQTPDGKLVQTVTTGADGGYNFPAVPVGQYQVLSTFGGYTTPSPLEAKVTPSGLAYLPKLVLVSPDQAGTGGPPTLEIITPTPR